MSDLSDLEPTGRTLLDVRNLTVDFAHENGLARVIDGLNLRVRCGERLAIVGESGSGKSVTARALMRLDRQAILGGQINFEGVDLVKLPERKMRRYRGASIGMVFQDPLGSLDPRLTIGDQAIEGLRINGVPRAEARARVLATLDEMGVPSAAKRMGAYPYEFSGGMRQRVVMAMALVRRPSLLIADEPTTALDTRIQEQVMNLITDMSEAYGFAVILITHDLGIVAGFADRVVVMYSGYVVEDSEVAALFAQPRHPYTCGLLGAVPRIDRPVVRLGQIPGAPPSAIARPTGCPFHPRCSARLRSAEFDAHRCEVDRPLLPEPTAQARRVACHLVQESDARVSTVKRGAKPVQAVDDITDHSDGGES